MSGTGVLTKTTHPADTVLESHFTLVDVPGVIETISVDGAHGWTSPKQHPVLNLMRWTKSDPKIAAQALDEVIGLFQNRGCGFDWMTGPGTEELVPLLYERGFLPPPLDVAAMVKTNDAMPETDPPAGYRIWKVEDVTDPDIANVMARGFEVPDEVGAVYHRAYITDSALQRTDIYAVSAECDPAPVAVGYLSYIANSPAVLMRVSATLDAHRGQGLYRALVNHRLGEALQNGRSQAFVHAYSDVSKKALIDLGFANAGLMQLHRWRP